MLRFSQIFTAEDVREMLREECQAAGSQAEWCRRKGVSEVVVGFILVGKREPTSPSVMRALGLERVWIET